MSSPLAGTTIYPTTPPIRTDLSRARLKEIATWIRDELDLHVARDGPDILRPDDVLTLHETFIALRHAPNITVSDLRASGIHKAVHDISGVATRWPGRLCDDCDKIISIWTEKFGPFGDIHPFLYGRGGRLEGIASVHEYSREALLKRWAETCPDNIHPKRSHRLGDLGFKAGQWWINPLLAHHAGIIGLEACEGGTTYDKHGAYALLLKDTGEIEAASEERFTYRVSQHDKGKFRLTSATPKSRDPVRVLRSHSINSVWGPKAGVRYEGLYSVKGWSIKQAKSTDLAGGQWKEDDILFDIRFERNDATPMEVVFRRPTATEVDDYAEYKRLRKVNREGKRKGPTASPLSKAAAPPIIPTAPPAATSKVPPLDTPSVHARKGMFKRLHFDDEAHIHLMPDEEVVSPKTTSDPELFPKSSTLAVPAQPNRTNTHDKVDASPSEGPARGSSPAGSNTSTAHTTASTNAGLNIREVAPWIDYDADLTIPSSPTDDTPSKLERPITQSTKTRDVFQESKSSLKASSPQSILYAPTRRPSSDFKAMANLGPSGSRKDTRKSIFVKPKNPMAKLFDGADDGADFGAAETIVWLKDGWEEFSKDGWEEFNDTERNLD